jgi:hypothetical protein
MRFRPGDESGLDIDALGGRGCENVIIDHCSASWSIDECVSFYRNNNITIQWCLISESLYKSHHVKGHHGFGGIWGGTDASLHHNLFAHHSSRNPRFASDDKNIDYRNNVVYNWGYNSAYGGERATVNMIANYYKSGPATQDSKRNRIIQISENESRWYISDNYVAGYPEITADNWNGGVQGEADKDVVRVDEPFPAAAVTTQTAEEAYQLVLADVGASLPERDSLDTRIIQEVRSGTATYGGAWGEGVGIIDSQEQVGGWPELKSTSPQGDSDHDGMPDQWEERYELNPDDPADGSEDKDEDGYTNVEEALNNTDPNQFIDYTEPENNVSSLPGPISTAPGELRSYSTVHSIGIEWDITGDSDHDAKCTVHYRPDGTDAWKEALPLFRVDYQWWYGNDKAQRPFNMFAGSILFLDPDTEYQVKLALSDPDGGEDTRILTIKSRPVPHLSGDGRTLHVAPDEGGGDGSQANPFKGLDAAQAMAEPGDTVLIHTGNYGSFEFNRSGKPGQYIAWKAAGDGGVVFSHIDVPASHVWLEGLTLIADQDTNGLKGRSNAADVVISRNSFKGFHYSIFLNRENRDWYIADNEIVGNRDPHTRGRKSMSGEGIELSHSSGHVVAYNRISRVADGISYPERNCDIYGNEIFDVSDDALEPDYGFANIRMWGNRMYNYQYHAISFQPMKCGPWYIIRNQAVGTGSILKFRVQDQFLLAHNTFIKWGPIGNRMHHILSSLSRNNLYISLGETSAVWVAYDCNQLQYCLPNIYTRRWMTDVDYDGFRWGGSAKTAFRWDNSKYYPDLESFVDEWDIEKHGIRVEDVFEKLNLPEEPGTVGPSYLNLKEGCNAIDAGAVLPNINDDFAGNAPDLGAYEYGKPLPHYGPRDK